MCAEVEWRLAGPWVARGDDLVEGPHVDEVEELREELDGEGGVDAAPPQEVHGGGEHVHDAGDHLLGAVLVGLEQHLQPFSTILVKYLSDDREPDNTVNNHPSYCLIITVIYIQS